MESETKSLAIECRDLHVSYKAKKANTVDAVRGLSFVVNPGEVVGFLGPNGAGKSSTLKALLGFVEPIEGTCEIFGYAAGSREARSRLGYLPEVAMYYPYLTPSETLTLYGELQGLSRNYLAKSVPELLDIVGLKNISQKQNRQLSKGMLQRVGIAQSLLGTPELLILDEVTSGLDPVGRQELRNLLKERQQQGCTLFFSSHELGEVEMLCDRLLLINKGQLVEERRMDELKQTLSRFEVTYMNPASMLGLSEEWEEISPNVFRVRVDRKEKLVEVIDRVTRLGGTVLDVVAEEGSLEDYFIRTIKGVA